MPIIAMTREKGSLGSNIAQEVARRLGYQFLRNDILQSAAREYRVREARLVGAVEEAPGFLERFRRPRFRYRSYLEAAVLAAALQDRVVMVGRWSTLFLRGIPHAIAVRVCAPFDVRTRRVMERDGIERDEAARRTAAYDDGVRARMRQMFDVDWTDPLLYDLVINTGVVAVRTAVGQVLALAAAPEFQATEASRRLLADRALEARVRAVMKATPATATLEVDIHSEAGHVRLAGVVGSEAARDSAVAVAREVEGVLQVSSEVKVFRRPVR
ncbi:MAG TPA: cytidylate kinase family protein [Gemmatimonadales bacterium]|nr:cytidylate kinase family protein [Gemmatimonadales bacterium]